VAVALGEMTAGAVETGVADGRGALPGVVLGAGPRAGRLLPGPVVGRGEWPLMTEAGKGEVSVRIGATA